MVNLDRGSNGSRVGRGSNSAHAAGPVRDAVRGDESIVGAAHRSSPDSWIHTARVSPVGVTAADDATGVAISEAGKRLNQRKMDFVEVEMGQWDCPECGDPLAGVFLVASTALVALLFEIKIFNAESEEHAGRIAKSTIGKALGAIPLHVLETTQID